MRLTRYLKPPQVKLELATKVPDPPPEGASPERSRWAVKEGILQEIVELLETTGKVNNPTKLLTDLVNRERKASTAIGGGIALPHVRTPQARGFALAFARSTAGLDFDAPDAAPVHFFIGVVAPPYDDKLYLQVYKLLAQAFLRKEVRDGLRAAADEHEVIRLLSRFGEP